MRAEIIEKRDEAQKQLVALGLVPRTGETTY
jgi:hypothetical protein